MYIIQEKLKLSKTKSIFFPHPKTIPRSAFEYIHILKKRVTQKDPIRFLFSYIEYYY